jgi:two-component system OmpR family response regulator
VRQILPFPANPSKARARDSAAPLSPHVLVVEDDDEIAVMLAEVLRENGFAVQTVSCGHQADAAFQDQRPDLIVLDVMLPGEDGFSVCRRLRRVTDIPIIMLTARTNEVDRIVGLEIGADDYVTKPFSTRELVARIRAHLRRQRAGQVRAEKASRQDVSAFRFLGWKLEPGARQLLDPGNVRISLTSMEFELLLTFCRNAGRVLSRDELLESTHAGQAGQIARNIDVHVSRIRTKLERKRTDDPLIKTVRLGGYVFTPAVEAVP